MNAHRVNIKNIMKECIKMIKKKTVTIIGANSYIARNLIHVLKQRDDITIAGLYDRDPKHADGEEKYEQVDLFSEESINKINFCVDLIFHFVGKTGSYNGFSDHNAFINVNEVSLLNILDAYRKQNSKAELIFPSTRLVYKGRAGLLKEDDDKEFKTIYSINKYACETYLQQYHRMFGVDYCIFRICVPYGSLVENAVSYGTAEMMLSKAQEGKNIVLYGNGEVRRTITYIGDLCNCLIAGSLSDRCRNDVFNIGGENYSLKEMGTLIAKNYGVDVDYIDWPTDAKKIESGDTVFDDKKLSDIINYKMQMTFEEWITDFSKKE